MIPNCHDCGVPLKDSRSVRCKPCSNRLRGVERAIKAVDFDIDTDDCIPWPYAMRGDYGIKNLGRTTTNAHRWVWTELVGPIGDDLHLDHTCRNTACVNIRHLDPVTSGENTRRSWAYRQRNPLCPQGHEFSGSNLIVTNRGWRVCRECQRAAARRYHQRTREQ